MEIIKFHILLKEKKLVASINCVKKVIMAMTKLLFITNSIQYLSSYAPSILQVECDSAANSSVTHRVSSDCNNTKKSCSTNQWTSNRYSSPFSLHPNVLSDGMWPRSRIFKENCVARVRFWLIVSKNNSSKTFFFLFFYSFLFF